MCGVPVAGPALSAAAGCAPVSDPDTAAAHAAQWAVGASLMLAEVCFEQAPAAGGAPRAHSGPASLQARGREFSVLRPLLAPGVDLWVYRWDCGGGDESGWRNLFAAMLAEPAPRVGLLRDAALVLAAVRLPLRAARAAL
eukprot:gene3665-41571_t